ncbi:MAG: hypothetical protein PWR06_2898 [Thermoanaerobacteraceae bacterium]|jgi:hypothetical protein|nr:hypothetical protein [Thermoanaerobacteraceae bacterium]
MSVQLSRQYRLYTYKDYLSWSEDDTVKVGLFEDLTIDLKTVFGI